MSAPTALDRVFATERYVPIVKAAERQTVTGIVLIPDVTDAHGDTIPADVILDAAEDFLGAINVDTKLGVEHNDFTLSDKLRVVQSYIAEIDFKLNGVDVLKGSWIIVVKVLDALIWSKVKTGVLTGFSIGGVAQTVPVGATDA